MQRNYIRKMLYLIFGLDVVFLNSISKYFNIFYNRKLHMFAKSFILQKYSLCFKEINDKYLFVLNGRFENIDLI